MARAKTVEELQAEQERIENELKIKTQKLKALKQQTQEQLRKERTHRLCTHGAMLEQYLPPEEYSDKQIDEFFRTMFQIPEVVVHRGTVIPCFIGNFTDGQSIHALCLKQFPGGFYKIDHNPLTSIVQCSMILPFIFCHVFYTAFSFLSFYSLRQISPNGKGKY